MSRVTECRCDLFVSLQVDKETSPRRSFVANILDGYQLQNPNLDVFVGPPELDARQWQDLLISSKFTIAPGGHNPETFRMFEALEAG